MMATSRTVAAMIHTQAVLKRNMYNNHDRSCTAAPLGLGLTVNAMHTFTIAPAHRGHTVCCQDHDYLLM